MVTFTIVVAFLALAASLVSLYLVGDTAKRIEEETKFRVEAQMRPLKKDMEQAACTILALQEKQEVSGKTIAALVAQMEESAKQVVKLTEDLGQTRGALTTLKRSIPSGAQNRSIQ